jgi:hypothetical protein
MTIMLNAAKNTLEDAWPFPWLEVVLTGTAPLVIPDLKYVELVKAGTAELLGADVRTLAVDDNDLNQTGTPERWYLTDQVGDQVTLRVWPGRPRRADRRLRPAQPRAGPERRFAADPGPLPPAVDRPRRRRGVPRLRQLLGRRRAARRDQRAARDADRDLRDPQPPALRADHDARLLRGRLMTTAAYVSGYQATSFKDFSGGLNLRDKADTVGESEAIDLLNVDFTERGAIRQRDGFDDLTRPTCRQPRSTP